MSKHTPGPWEAELYRNGAFDVAIQHGPLVICSRSQHETRADEMHANARLIAAAPDLLEALQWICSEIACECELVTNKPCGYCRGRAAIKLALGES